MTSGQMYSESVLSVSLKKPLVFPPCAIAQLADLPKNEICKAEPPYLSFRPAMKSRASCENKWWLSLKA